MRVLSQVTADPKRGTHTRARVLARSRERADADRVPRVATVPAAFGLHRIRIHASPATRAPLRVGAADDAHEREADRIAHEALHAPQRRASGTCPCGGRVEGGGECAACRQKRLARLQRSALPDAGATIGAARDASAPAIVHDVLRTPGRPLDVATRAFMEPRFGCDFGFVQLHTDARAAESARAVGARAYTVGRHVVFAAGEFDPAGAAGRQLLAHELAHVRQQTDSPAAADTSRTLRRMLRVHAPTANIPNPGGRGRVMTNAAQVTAYLTTICDSPFAPISVTGGEVRSPMCEDPTLIPAVVDRTVHGCMCLCDLVTSSRTVTIHIDDVEWPHTTGDRIPSTTPGVGADSEVRVPSENAPLTYGAPTVSGRLQDEEPWLVLAHEMCGHAWLASRGLEDPGSKTSRPGHVPAIARENLIRAEHGIEARGIWRDPFCGEGYSHPKGTPTPTGLGDVVRQDPTFGDECRAWRDTLNWFYCTRFTIADRIPDVVPNLCPPGTVRV
ncbi:MAG: DUF4157 domain-containing protein [Gemmatimonadetes bacterium]|nr:DUF4157 domain-containing protein [Gemmatimonadota bacterium]